MNAWKVGSPRLLAAAASLCLPLLTGCCTTALLESTVKETFEGIRGAWLRPDELGIEYTTHSDL